MFGDLLGDLQKKQADLKAKLAEIIIEESVNDAAVTVSVNANRELLNISIDSDKVDLNDTTEIEDLLVVAINNAMELAQAKEAEQSKSLVSGMIPPGMENLLG